ncbi:hypothetical protein KAR91_68000 [Candidatus Pacearchaeota archaeon]|nr:hypothetical protein [Candidatus Pacearchaeota archaeon]
MILRGESRRGQVTIFIIVAVVIVVLTVGFFMFRSSLFGGGIPSSIDPIYNTFLTCLENDVLVGAGILGSQGGYMEMPTYDFGSEYMPFSSQLDFIGSPVPYWYYVSGNNIEKTNIPSLSFMQRELGSYIEGTVRDCVLEDYYNNGFSVFFGEPEAKVKIRDNEIVVDLEMAMNVNNSVAEESIFINSHSVSVKSSLGELYNAAREVHDEEQSTLFLEKRGLDVIRSYAPVDGVEISCAPKIWNAPEIVSELREAISDNTYALRTSGSDFDLSKKENKYFVLDLNTDSNVQFLNSPDWPSTYEIVPSDGDLLMADPVGTQSGLGILGFCYVPYHFVYDAKYPVLVQVYSGDSLEATSEIFQFATAVIIKANNPREPLDGSAVFFDVPELCAYKNTETTVNVYDTSLNPIEADISYECFGVSCDIGETRVTSSLTANFPQCVNGFVVAKADGYKEEKQMYSTTTTGTVDVIMDKTYERKVNLAVDSRPYDKDAIITFSSDDLTKTILYPEQTMIELAEGQYDVSVRVFRESTLSIAKSIREQCVDIPKSGVGGVLGFTQEECYDIEIPAQVISSALSGGGEQSYYVLESELAGSSSIDIYADSLPIPTTLEQLQNNYNIFEVKGLEIYFR